jgi:hypothetical protein
MGGVVVVELPVGPVVVVGGAAAVEEAVAMAKKY